MVSVANSSLNFSITLSFKLYRDLKVTLKATLPKLEADTLSCKTPSQLTKNETSWLNTMYCEKLGFKTRGYIGSKDASGKLIGHMVNDAGNKKEWKH